MWHCVAPLRPSNGISRALPNYPSSPLSRASDATYAKELPFISSSTANWSQLGPSKWRWSHPCLSAQHKLLSPNHWRWLHMCCRLLMCSFKRTWNDSRFILIGTECDSAPVTNNDVNKHLCWAPVCWSTHTNQAQTHSRKASGIGRIRSWGVNLASKFPRSCPNQGSLGFASQTRQIWCQIPHSSRS